MATSIIVDSYASISQDWKTFAQIFDSLKIENDSNFYFEEKVAKKTQTFQFLMSRYFVMGASIDINVGVFREAFVRFLKSVVLQLFPKSSQSYANLNVKSRPKFNSP